MKGTFFKAFPVNVCFILLQERELQGLIEKAYVDYLKQGKVKEEFKFETAKHKYKLVFSSIGMYQVNLETGTKRRVRRRPGKVISNEDMEDLKWYERDKSIFLFDLISVLHFPYLPSSR